MDKIANRYLKRLFGVAGPLNRGAQGHSLVEMVTVIAIVSILLTIATLGFKDYTRRYRTEAQTRLIFAELLKARVNAVCQRRATRVKLYPQRFEIYSSQQDDSSGVKPLQTHPLSYPVVSNAPGNPALGHRIDFGSDGLANQKLTICLEQNEGSGSVDSIKVSQTRTSIGKKDKGDDCISDNITVR